MKKKKSSKAKNEEEKKRKRSLKNAEKITEKKREIQKIRVFMNVQKIFFSLLC